MEAVAAPPSTFRLTPRPYQYEAVAALLAATARGIHRPLLVLPTGTGKTIVFALLVQRRRRSLILAHRMNSSSKPSPNCTSSTPPWPSGSCRRRATSIPPRSWSPVCRPSAAAPGWRVWYRISRPSSLMKRTTPPHLQAYPGVLPGLAGRWTARGRRHGHPERGDHTRCGRSLTALSIRKPCWR